MIYPSKPDAQAKKNFACASGFDGRVRSFAGVALFKWNLNNRPETLSEHSFSLNRCPQSVSGLPSIRYRNWHDEKSVSKIPPEHITPRRGGRVADCTGLENRQGRKFLVGSNPTLSAGTVEKTPVFSAVSSFSAESSFGCSRSLVVSLSTCWNREAMAANS